jgi:hypothetical protein
MTPHIGLVVCRNFVDEAQAVCRACQWGDVSVRPVAPRCERPWEGWPELLGAANDGPRADTLVVVGAGCLPAGSPPPSVHIVRAASCAALLTNESLIQQWVRAGSFLVTPGWLQAWEEAVRTWGGGERAPGHPASSATVLRLLDTGSDPATQDDLVACAAYLGLEPARESVGTDVFTSRLANAVADVRTSHQLEEAFVQSAESTMLLDLAADLMDAESEVALLSKIGELLRTLLPSNICRIASVRHGRVEHAATSSGAVDERWFLSHVRSRNTLTMLAEDHGFVLQLRHHDDVVGIVEITRLAMPEHIERYAKAALSLSGICGAAIVRCRALAGIISICSGCKRVRSADRWEPVDVYIRSHSDADFSHGLCPECMKRLYPDIAGD